MNRLMFARTSAGAPVLLSLLLGCSSGFAVDLGHHPLIPSLPAVPQQSVSTVPGNGDINPYGVAFVPPGFPGGGLLAPGDILVSNFNNSSNAQGTGTTIVKITPGGVQSLFFQGAAGLGLTTALGVLRSGFVLVGNLPSPTGVCTDPGHQGVGQGSLLVVNRHGKQVAALTNSALLDGPWDLTVLDQGNDVQVFVSSVLNGVVTRLDVSMPENDSSSLMPFVRRATQIGSGYAHRCDPGALVVGPTGLALDADNDLLYVASTADNAIYGIDHAASIGNHSGKGRVIYQDNQHLRGPVGLLLAPNGDLVATNGDAVNASPNQQSEMVEFTASGHFVAERSVNSSAPGGAFGIALSVSEGTTRFVAVDDVLNVLDVWAIH
jgi:hypothetical protein